MKREKIAARQRFLDDLARRDALRGTAPLKPRKREFRGHRRMRLSRPGEVRALARILQTREPEQSLWPHIRREISMTEIADIEIVEPFVRLGTSGNEGSINLDEDTARALYAMAWARFENALINANALYHEEPIEQPYVFNRVKRLLWEADSLKQAIEVVYYMTAPPDLEDDDDEDLSPIGSAE